MSNNIIQLKLNETQHKRPCPFEIKICNLHASQNKKYYFFCITRSIKLFFQDSLDIRRTSLYFLLHIF